jgi:putative SOS response-associated peptidase YedK
VRRNSQPGVLIIDPAVYDRWLTAAESPADLLKPYPADEMGSRPVSSEVNNPAKDEPDLVRKIALATGVPMVRSALVGI